MYPPLSEKEHFFIMTEAFSQWLDDAIKEQARIPPDWKMHGARFGLNTKEAQRIVDRHPEKSRQVTDGRATHSRRFRHQVAQGFRFWRAAQADLGFFGKYPFFLGKCKTSRFKIFIKKFC